MVTWCVLCKFQEVWVTHSCLFLDGDGLLDFKQGQKETWPMWKVRVFHVAISHSKSLFGMQKADLHLSVSWTHTQQQYGKCKHTLHKAMFLMALDRAAYGMKCCATGSDQRLSTFILKIFGDSDSHKFPWFENCKHAINKKVFIIPQNNWTDVFPSPSYNVAWPKGEPFFVLFMMF